MNESYATTIVSAPRGTRGLAWMSSTGCAPLVKRLCRRGMTLTELLIVIFVISLIMALAPPAFTGLLGAQNITTSSDQVSAMLDFARSEAASKDTYVWLGFENTTADGSNALRLLAVRSVDGSSNLTSTNFLPASKQLLLRSTQLVSLSSLPASLQAKVATAVGSATMLDLSSAGTAQSFQSGTETYTPLVLFTPEGEALVPQSTATTVTTPFVPYILIALRSVKGTQLPANDANGAAIVLNGGTSSLQNYRP